MAENGKKKWLVGTLSATALAVGSFTYDLVKPTIQDYIKRNAPGYVQNAKEAFIATQVATSTPSMSTTSQPENTAETEAADTDTAAAEESAFKTAYNECNAETGNNPDIDLNNEIEVHRANLKCLIVNKNQGAYLDKRAASDSNLRDNLQEIRNELTQQSENVLN